jgi:glycosyltransferase involved in cell wall biosynthesis
MRIGLLAPPYLPVPPAGYGGTEKIVSLLADGLVEKGHEVTLFASGDSHTKANLISIFPKALGNSGLNKGDALLPLLHYHECAKRADTFDIIHSHAQYLGLFGLSGVHGTPVIHTWHGSYYEGEVPDEKRKVLEAFADNHFITISDNQRGGMPNLHYVKTVYNGIDLSLYPFCEKPNGEYLLWVGRIVEKKGPLPAIQAAKKLGMRLILAAAVDPVDQAYFDSVIRPEVDHEHISFTGEVNHDQMVDLYRNAKATLFPISWHEPFGLVLVESMASGTPVVAYKAGSVPEIVEDGKTGFIVDSVDGLVDSVKKIGDIDRATCRKHVEDHFSKEKMVEGYEQAYELVIKEHS